MHFKKKLRLDNCKYFQFLWRDMDQLKEPSCFEFQRLVFGLDSAPFLGQYIFQKSAKENQKDFPFAAETVLQSTYMDDSMDSMVNEDEAVKLVPKLDELWRKNRMQPRRWLPSSRGFWQKQL